MAEAPTSKPSTSSKSAATVIIIVVVGVAIFFGLCVCSPILVALLLPAVQSARFAARTLESKNHLKQIGLALLNYESVNGRFPPAWSPDDSGKPATSWRTMILPHLEHQNLYDAYDSSQPWDSEANSMARETALSIYQSPHANNRGLPLTNYVVVTGEETAFPPGGRGTSIRQFMDGTTNTILLVEIANSDIEWAEPRDLDFNSFQMVNDGADPGTTNVIPVRAAVLRADGAVLDVGRTTDSTLLKEYLTLRGREQHLPLGE